MAKFCQTCGSPCQEGELFCGKCGTRLPQAENSNYQAVQSTPNASSAPAGSNLNLTAYATIFKRYLSIVLIVVAVFSLVLAILNIFGTYDVSATAKMGSYKQTSSGPIKDLYDSGEFTMLQIVNIIYGLVSLGLAALSALLFLKLNRGDADCKKLYSRIAMIGLFGTVAYMILFWIFGSVSEYGAKVSASPHFTAWIALIIHGVLFATDKLLLKDDNGTLRP